jgi:hypothetical protein
VQAALEREPEEKEMKRRHRVAALAFAGAATLAAPPGARANHLEAKVYVITDWPAGTCSANDVGSWDDMAFAWFDEIGAGPVFFKDQSWTNGTQARYVFCDPDSPQSPCSDHNHIDDADAALVAFHGSDSGKHWSGALRVQTGDDCRIHGPEGAATDALFVGDMDLEFLHFSSCNSMDDDNLKSVWRMFQDGDSAVNGARLHQADGFHGVMWISSGRADDYEDFAEDAHYVSIRTAWLDNLYDEDASGSFDQCPVAYAIGHTFTDAKQRLSGERYNHIYSDPTGANYVAFAGFFGCNPMADDPFSDPWQ